MKKEEFKQPMHKFTLSVDQMGKSVSGWILKHRVLTFLVILPGLLIVAVDLEFLFSTSITLETWILGNLDVLKMILTIAAGVCGIGTVLALFAYCYDDDSQKQSGYKDGFIVWYKERIKEQIEKDKWYEKQRKNL